MPASQRVNAPSAVEWNENETYIYIHMYVCVYVYIYNEYMIFGYPWKIQVANIGYIYTVYLYVGYITHNMIWYLGVIAYEYNGMYGKDMEHD